jgi:heat shock protein HspQ
MATRKFIFELGDEVKEKVTGFTGIVMARVEYATGCMQIGVLSRELRDGKPQDWFYSDQERFTKVGGHVDVSAPKGGPQQTPSHE